VAKATSRCRSAELATAHPEVSIGSYPFQRDGVHGSNVVVRSQDGAAVDHVMAELWSACSGGRMIPAVDIVETIRATWPPAVAADSRPLRPRRWRGRRQPRFGRASARSVSDGADVTRAEIAAVETAQRGTPLFMVFGWQTPLDHALVAEGYSTRDETLVLAAPVADIAEARPPPVSCFEIWPPLAVQEEIWCEGGIGPARLAIMERATGPKTSLFGRIKDRPAGTAFIAVHGEVAMLHALEVIPSARRQGLARLMVRAAAAWAADHGARDFTVLVTAANDAAQRLYASLGLQPVEKYHYRVK
jgi:GNAT superfamily N-acetyltransferase